MPHQPGSIMWHVPLHFSDGRLTMRPLFRMIPFVCLVGLLAVSGCQKVNATKEYKMNAGEVQFMEIDPPNRDQDVTVTIDSSGPVDVFLVSKSDGDAAVKSVEPPTKPIDGK